MSKETNDLDLRKLAKLEAKLETCWWKSHHKKDWGKTIDCMARLYVALYNISFEIAEKIVDLRVEAAKVHDLAEEPRISEEESDEHWANVKKIMTEHFLMLEKHRKR
ncbi:MAG: hypothetical protein U9P70_00165 [Patescibacteria group bacterium]|nr:hypothetical protein [Patescibacteria group bacterium]